MNEKKIKFDKVEIINECRKLIPSVSHVPIRSFLRSLDQDELKKWLEDIAKERIRIKALINELEEKLCRDDTDIGLYESLCWYSCIPEHKGA